MSALMSASWLILVLAGNLSWKNTPRNICTYNMLQQESTREIVKNEMRGLGICRTEAVWTVECRGVGLSPRKM